MPVLTELFLYSIKEMLLLRLEVNFKTDVRPQKYIRAKNKRTIIFVQLVNQLCVCVMWI